MDVVCVMMVLLYVPRNEMNVHNRVAIASSVVSLSLFSLTYVVLSNCSLVLQHCTNEIQLFDTYFNASHSNHVLRVSEDKLIEMWSGLRELRPQKQEHRDSLGR
jgi:hypothetical protein